MGPRRFAALAAWSLLTVTLSAAAPGAAVALDAAPAVPRNSTEAAPRRFSAALSRIADQWHVAVVAEAAPWSGTLVIADAMAGSQDAPKTAAAAVAQIAAAYDYDLRPLAGSNRVFVLTKRYTSPQDLPAVTLAECAAASSEINHILDAYSPRLNARQAAIGTPLSWDLIRTLRADQRSALEKGALAVSQLDASQKALVRQAALYLYLQLPDDDAKNSTRLLTAAPSGTFAPQPGSRRLLLLPAGAAAAAQGRPPLWQSGPPMPAGMGGIKKQAAAEGDGDTVASVVPMLVKGDPYLADITVDPAVAGIPVTVAGARWVAASEVLKALADMDDLRVRAQGGRKVLARRPHRLPDSVTDVPAKVRESLPPAIFRYLHEEKPRSRQVELMINSANALLAGIAPRLGDSPDARLPVAEAGSQNRSALALVLMTGILNDLNVQLKSDPPLYIKQFDSVRLNGGEYDQDGQRMCRLYLEVRDPETNRLLDTVGVARVPVPKG